MGIDTAQSYPKRSHINSLRYKTRARMDKEMPRTPIYPSSLNSPTRTFARHWSKTVCISNSLASTLRLRLSCMRNTQGFPRPVPQLRKLWIPPWRANGLVEVRMTMRLQNDGVSSKCCGPVHTAPTSTPAPASSTSTHMPP